MHEMLSVSNRFGYSYISNIVEQVIGGLVASNLGVRSGFQKHAASYREIAAGVESLLKRAYPDVPSEEWGLKEILPSSGSFKAADNPSYHKAVKNVSDRLYRGWGNVFIDLNPFNQIDAGVRAKDFLKELDELKVANKLRPFNAANRSERAKHFIAGVLGTVDSGEFTIRRHYNPVTKTSQIVVDLK